MSAIYKGKPPIRGTAGNSGCGVVSGIVIRNKRPPAAASNEARQMANHIGVALSRMRHPWAVVCPDLEELPLKYSPARELVDLLLDKRT